MSSSVLRTLFPDGGMLAAELDSANYTLGHLATFVVFGHLAYTSNNPAFAAYMFDASSGKPEMSHALRNLIANAYGDTASELAELRKTLTEAEKHASAQYMAGYRDALQQSETRAHQEYAKGKESTRGEIETLRAQLALLTESVDATRKRRNVPVHIGQTGEDVVATALEDAFPDAEIANVSKHASSGDLHIKTGGALIVVEVKNKQKLTRADVSAFETAVRSPKCVAQTPIGGVFISLESSNIPGHGSFDLDTVGTPKLYMGFADIAKATAVVGPLVALFAATCHRLTTTSGNMVNALAEHFVAVAHELASTQKHLHAVKSALEKAVTETNRAGSSVATAIAKMNSFKIEQ